MTSTYDTVNKAWKKTCSLLFGEEVGELEEYSPYLKEFIHANIYKKSSFSDKKIAIAIREYNENSRFISFDEVDFGKKFEPLNINEIKDIDSIIEATSERSHYCGDILLGKCRNVERCSNVTDAHYAIDIAQFANVKYMADCTVGRDSNNCFGVYGPGDTEFCIRCTQTVNVKRSFELWVSQNCSDCYYVYGLDGCSDCLFSFHLKNRKYCIGNLEMARDKYIDIKKKLLVEMADKLKKDKMLPSLLDIVNKSKEERPEIEDAEQEIEITDKKIIETKFSKTTELLFGRSLYNIDDYSDWLYRHAHKIRKGRSTISGKELLFVPYIISLPELPIKRLITMGEARSIGDRARIEPHEAQNMSLENAHESIGKIAYFNVDFRAGENSNLVDCTTAIGSSDCYRASAIVRSKYCACGMWPTKSSNCFGFDTLFESDFCINCYHSGKLVRCFEMDNCRNCADSMFCHNCENVKDSMFCFNTKNLRYAIGNVPIDPEKYKELKALILKQIADELENRKDFRWSIYNIGRQN